MRSILIIFIGYSFVYWGATLLVGGWMVNKSGKWQRTGSWPFMYALFGLGSTPPFIAGATTQSDVVSYMASNTTTLM
jgi:hypothetical protein